MNATPVLFITGTDTEVGKTVTTAAIAAALATRGAAGIAVDKPTQTGVLPGEAGDVQEAQRLSGVKPISEGVRLRAPMAPVAAALREGATLPSMHAHVTRIRSLAARHERVLVEGAGGLLVQLDNNGNTLAELAAEFGSAASVIVVCRSGLGTLNHTALTLEALHHRGLHIAGLVIGSWPERPTAVELDNRQHFSARNSKLGVPLLGAIPARAAQLAPQEFRARAQHWLPLLR